MDSQELGRWMAFEKVRPLTPEEARHAELMHWLGCLWSNNPPPIKRFLPDRLSTPDGQLTPAEARAQARRVFG